MQRLLFSLMLVGLNSVDRLMICAKTGMPNNDEQEDVRKGNADSCLVGKG